MSILTRIFGDGSAGTLRRLRAAAEKVAAFEPALLSLSDEALKGKTAELRTRLAGGETIDSLAHEAFAVVREAARRTLGERHYDAQIMGGLAIFGGAVAEMRTGEGKTLVATAPAYVAALEGRGVHLVTVNDYLARRDAAWMGQVYHALGLSVSVIDHGGAYRYDPTATSALADETRDETGGVRVAYDFLRPCSRREAYEADVTYATNSELGFDYLRDSLEHDPAQLRQREHAFAIVDEVDSILIDEARTPLIISGPAQEPESLYRTFAQVVATYVEGEDYEVDQKHRSVAVLPSGIEKAERALGQGGFYTERGVKLAHHLENALRAKALYRRDKEYVVREGEIVIVDEFTGRMQPGRRWSQGLHQAVEAKEGVVVRRESRTYASITYQHYFKRYRRLAGMTGTAMTSAEEFLKVYGLDVIAVPTHRAPQRLDREDLVFRTEAGKWTAVAREVARVHATGRPVLVGTAAIDQNEIVSAKLRAAGVPHEVLNAKNHEREAEIISRAGERGAVTVATNMAGRGVDIKLGGLPYEEAKRQEVAALGGLFVLGTARHDARRIDNQLRGRAGRQGDPGETVFFVSLEDELMARFASPFVGAMMAKLQIPEDEPIQARIVSKSIESAQTRVEGAHFDSRKSLLDYDTVVATQRDAIYTRRRGLLMAEGEQVFLAAAAAAGEGGEALVAAVRARLGDAALREVRRAALAAIDRSWIDHLELMDYLRSSVSLKAWGQRDPLVEYQREGRRLFEEMEATVVARLAGVLQAIASAPAPAAPTDAVVEIARAAVAQAAGRDDASDAATQARIGRNDLVTVARGQERQTLKWKKAEALLAEGWKIEKIG
jgi:preprotein translocase subunit SecA